MLEAGDTGSPAAANQVVDLSVQPYQNVVLQFEKVGRLEGRGLLEADGSTPL